MEVSGGSNALKNSLSQEEYDSIEGGLRSKIENVLEDHIQDYLTAKACFETSRTSLEARVAEVETLRNTAVQERDEFKTKWEGISAQYEDTNKRLSVNYAQLNKHRDDIQKLEKELESLRRERDEAVDEKQVSASMLERRELEIERLRSDIAALNSELRSANAAKLEALTLGEDIQAKLVDLEYREKRFESERTLLTQQVEELTRDLGRANQDIAQQRRESTSSDIVLQTKISELEEELRISKELNGKLSKNNEDLQAQLDEVTKKLRDQMANEDKLIGTFQNDMKAQTKLTDLYKERVEAAESRAGELSTAVKELQRLLKEASDHSGNLETRLAQQEADAGAELEAKEEAIKALKEELHHANILLEAVKQESSEAAVSRLSPMAASASKLLKSGLTLTQLYTKYAETMQELLVEKQEKERLNEYIEKILKEIEEKAPVLAKQYEDYAHALTSMETMTQKVDELENEQVSLRRANSELETSNNFLARENKKLAGTINHLSRQVCFLMREIEAVRGNDIPLHDTSPESRAEARTTSEVIEKHLVTFKDIKELVTRNHQLLAAIQALGEKEESIESDKDNEKVKELQSELERVEAKVGDLVEREKFLLKEIGVIKNQRDVYHRLYKQHSRNDANRSASIGDLSDPDQSAEDLSKLQSPSPSQVKPTAEDEKSFKIILEELKKEYKTYREEKNSNEKVMNETISKMRDQISELVRSKAEATSQAEFYCEKVKALAKKVESLTAEVESLEKRCQNYVNTIGKHEFNMQYLRNEALEAMNKLSVAEVKVENLTQENRLLKDNERRLIKERELEKKEKHGQELLMANLEALKARFECSEADSKKKLESRLDEANMECSNLRRRLQDEQDRLTRRVELLEEQTKTAKHRLDEERTLKAKVTEELETLRNEMREKEGKIEEMQEQLTTAINSSQPVLERETKIKELEAVIREKDANINSLNERLTAAKKYQAELSEVSQGIEKQLTELTEQYEQYRQESEKAIDDLKKVEAELKSANLTLELKMKTSNAEETEERAQREAELSSLRSKCECLTSDLDKTKEKEILLEKETREAVRHAQEAEGKASNLSVQTNQLKQELDSLRGELMEARNSHALLEAARGRETERNTLEMAALREKITALEKLQTESEERIKELTNVNDLLHEQIQELGQKVTVLNDANDTGVDFSNESLTSENFRESDKMLQVLRLLRKEKSSAIANAEFMKNEKQRMEAEVAVLKKQIDDLKASLEERGPSTETPSIAAERHAQLLAKVETLNELTETNKSLREDRDKLSARLAEVEKNFANVDSDVIAPNNQKIASLQAQVEQLQTENTALKAENQRWRDRTNELIEKHNKNPDEMKRLLQEKDNLTKQLGTEREQSKLTKTRLEETLLQLKREKDESLAAHSTTKDTLANANKELATVRDNGTKAAEKAAKLERDLAAQETTLQDLRSKEMQIRQIAKKYKMQYSELAKTLEEKNKAGPSQAAMEEAEERIKQLTDQVLALSTENEALRRENDSLKNGVVEREERAKTLLKNARARVQTLTEENKSLSKELADSRRIRGPGESSTADSQTRNLETRISRLEQEKEEEVTEKNRLRGELDILTQRLGIMQRQLEKYQQGSKPSTSGGEKPSGETPTANIKPLSGPSTSSTKQTQLAQAATVPPWRDTPFASIRPMASQPRTVVVSLPPRQTGSSTSSQPVLVAPQQQVVHTSSTCESLSSSPTSSHIDYMPATSCALNIHQNAGLSVIIGQHMEAEAGNEDSAPPAPTHHVQPNQNAAVALVLPQPAAQQQPQSQGEAASTEAVSGVVSGSNQEQVSEQSVSASNHSTLGIWSRSVDEPSGAVASSQIEQGVSVASGSGSSQPGTAASSQQAASSTTSVTTSVAPVLKRPMTSPDDADAKPLMPAAKRSRLLVSQGEASGEMLLRADGLEVEYQVPTSSQRDQEDDILVVSDDDDLPDDGAMDEGQEFEEEGEEEARYGIDAYSRDAQDMASYEEGEGPDIDEGSTTDQDNNEVDIIDDSNEVPNQCESTRGVLSGVAGGSGSVVDGSVATGGEATSSLGSTTSSHDYQSRRRHHSMVLSYEDPGDDSIVPSTPTLFVPRRTDGFGEAVSSPHVPSARFTFAEGTTAPTSRVPVAGVAQVASEGMDDTRMDLSQLDEGTGRSVPTTPSHVSPQDPSGPEIGQSSSQELSVSGNVGLSEGSATVPDAPLVDQQEVVPEDGGDGVTSEGEKTLGAPPSALQASSDVDVELDEPEGREAEASPTATRLSAVTPSSSSRGNTARRAIRIIRNQGGHPSRGGAGGRTSAPTPIVWSSPETQPPIQLTGPQNISMPMSRDLMFSGQRIRGIGSTRTDQRPSSGFRGRPRRRMAPYHPGNFGPRF